MNNTTATPTVRRSAAQITADRAELVARFDLGWNRAPRDARSVDLEALVAAGRLERTVRKEYDRQTGYGANLFGGAGACVRRRAYYRLPATPSEGR